MTPGQHQELGVLVLEEGPTARWPGTLRCPGAQLQRAAGDVRVILRSICWPPRSTVTVT